ncbi:hypothetical protein ACWGIU_22415 [Streptomyces sp. NPDC054840]
MRTFTVVADGRSQGVRPTADLPPSEPTVELFEACTSACGEERLLQAHLVKGNITGPAHQTCTDALSAHTEPSLDMMQRALAPVRHQRMGIAAEWSRPMPPSTVPTMGRLLSDWP